MKIGSTREGTLIHSFYFCGNRSQNVKIIFKVKSDSIDRFSIKTKNSTQK